jgi:SAM-dependent methyltransferase
MSRGDGTWHDRYRDTRDTLLRAAGFKDRFIPPKRMMRVGSRRRYVQTRDTFFGYYRELCALTPEDRVLDVGCGTGRMAVPFGSFLREPGHYVGFDVDRDAIRWCQEQIAPHFRSLQFLHVDLVNSCYAPRGCGRAQDFRFPFPDASFSFVFLNSVFTHLLDAEIQNYIREIARVLEPRGRCFITFFLLDGAARSRLAERDGPLRFAHTLDRCRIADPQNPALAVAHDETRVLELLQRCGLRPTVHHGSWSGRELYLDYQDILIATRL